MNMKQTQQLQTIRKDLLSQVNKLEELSSKAFIIGDISTRHACDFMINEFTEWLSDTATKEDTDWTDLIKLSVIYKLGQTLMSVK